MVKNIAQIARAPGCCVVVGPEAILHAVVASVTCTHSPLMTLLTARPRTLHNIWVEWKFRGGRLKPSKIFNLGMRGAMKNRYCFGKVLWYKMVEMVRVGDTAHVACDKIYTAYCKNPKAATKYPKDAGGSPLWFLAGTADGSGFVDDVCLSFVVFDIVCLG